MRKKMNQKDTRSRALKNKKNTGSSPTKDDDDFRDVTDPYPDEPEDFVPPEEDYREAYRRQNLNLSQIALEYYNKRNRTNYELVEPMDCSIFSHFPIWMHLNFTAKLKSALNGDGNSSAKLFFVEFYHEPGRWVVNACRILKGKPSHCDFCQLVKPDTIKHPTHGFHMKHLAEPYALRSQMNQKDTRSRALQNQKNTGSSPTKDDDDFRDVTDPYPDEPEDFVPPPEEDYTEAYRRQNLNLSQIALEYYNKRNRTNYELVEPMDCKIFGPPLWAHLNFTAKLKSALDGDGNSSAKLFFVEFYHEPDRWVVNACRILKGKPSNCDYCQLFNSYRVKHPTHGFHMKHLSEPYALRSRARGSMVG